jgi:glycosyltransferase involved in cell wall biosynthesis
VSLFKYFDVMDISVIIPTCNRIKMSGKALQSVFAQIPVDFEIIVVVDGSTDGTMEYVKTLGNQVLALNQSNQGPGAARNLGAMRAKGDHTWGSVSRNCLAGSGMH